MDTDIPSQEGREDLPSELSFVSAPQEIDPTPVVTRPSEVNRPESTSAVVTRSCAREGQGISVTPEAQIEPEIKTRPEQEIATCEGDLGAARPSTTEVTGMFTFTDMPETVIAHTIKQVTTTSLFTAPSQTSPPHPDPIPPPHTGVTAVCTQLKMVAQEQCLIAPAQCGVTHSCVKINMHSQRTDDNHIDALRGVLSGVLPWGFIV